MNRQPLLPYLWMLLSNASFACMTALAKGLSELRVDWQLIAVARAGLVLLFALGLALSARATLVLWRPGVLWLRSLAGSCSMVCTFFALTRPGVPISDVLTLTNTFPVWVALLSWLALGDRPSAWLWLAVGSSVLGVALIAWHPHEIEANLAVAAALGASFFTSVAMLGLNRLGNLDTRAIVVHFSGVALCFCLAAYLVFERHAPPFAVPEGAAVWLLLGLGVSATFGQIFLTRAFSTGVATRVSVVGLTQVVFGLVIDAVIFGQPFRPLALLGMTLVLAPTAWLMWSSRPRTAPAWEETPVALPLSQGSETPVTTRHPAARRS